jgi:hypothetical protein
MSDNKHECVDDHAIHALNRADDLMHEKKQFDEAQQQEWDKLPLFYPGKTYSCNDSIHGFRVLDGYSVTYNQKDDVRISNNRECPYVDGKTFAIINHWPDGGISWVYWTNEAVNCSSNMLLSECAVRHGMGGWLDKANDRRAKVVFLDEDRSVQAGKCFVVAMQVVSTGRMLRVKGNELNNEVFRVYRSCIPEHVQNFITLRELINARQRTDVGNESLCMNGFWQM